MGVLLVICDFLGDSHDFGLLELRHGSCEPLQVAYLAAAPFKKA